MGPIDWLAAPLVLWGLWLIGSGNRLGWLVGLAGSLLWALYALTTGQPALFLLNLAISAFQARGFWAF